MAEKRSDVDLIVDSDEEVYPEKFDMVGFANNMEKRRKSSMGAGSILDGPLDMEAVRKASKIGSRRSSTRSGIPAGPEHDPDMLRMLYRPDDLSFTWRSVLLGTLCGCLIAIANMYLGLRSGMTMGATLFATLLGSVVLAPIVKWQGGELGIREHTCFQAAGTAAGGMNGGLVAPVLVLFWNGYFTGTVVSNLGSLILLVFGAGLFGLVFGVTLRKFAIVKQQLVFPDGTAAAEVLLTMYASKTGKEEGKKKTRVMLIFFTIGFIGAIIFYFIPVLIDVPIFHYLSNCGMGTPYSECIKLPSVYQGMLVLHYWGFRLLLDPVFVAAAFMVGPNVNVWFFIGSLSVALVGAYDFSSGHLGPQPSFSTLRDKVTLFPAVICMLVSSIFAIALSYRMFIDSFRDAKKDVTDQDADEESDVLPEELDERNNDTPVKIWAPLLGGGVVFACLVYMLYFGDEVKWYEAIIAIVCTFPVAVVIVQVLGKTNWGMSAIISKFIMIILGLCGASANSMLLLGNMVSQASAQTGEVCQCYKTGHLVNAAPRAQFNAQLVGTTFGGFCSIFAFWLYSSAYPCMMDPKIEECPFAMAAAHGWGVIAEAVSGGVTIGDSGTETITNVSFYLLIAMPIITCVEMALTHFVIPERFHGYMPVWTVFYLAWLMAPYYGFAQMFGQIIHWGWGWARPEQCQKYTYSVAAGLVSGGAIATLVTALLSVLNVPTLGWGQGYH